MTSLFPTLEEPAPSRPPALSPSPPRPAAFPAYVLRNYIRDTSSPIWRWSLLIDSDQTTHQWEVQLSVWSPRYDRADPLRHNRKPGYRFRRLPCPDRPAAEQLALRLEAMIQRRIGGTGILPVIPAPASGADTDPYRSLALDF